MDKNKSIDGLTTRRPKKVAAKPAAKKPLQKAPALPAKPKKTVVKNTTVPVKTRPNSIPKEPSHETPQAPVQETTEPTTPKKTKAEINEDFLKPTQVFDFDEDSGELKATEPTDTDKTPSKPDKKKKEKKKVSKKRKIITSIILVIVLLLLGGLTWVVLWGNDIIAKITGGQGNIFDLVKFIEPTYDPLKTDENGRTNILAFGTSGFNMDGEEYGGVHDGASLTDSIMMISLNQETGDIAMLSLPRDLKASPTCTATSKINEIYWCNGGKGDATIEEEAAAAQALMTEVGSILGVDFQYFAHLNWGSLQTIVDIIDGITITLDEGIYDYYYTGSVYDPGVPYTINGIQAVALSRARHGTTGGDFSRGASQQKILIGIKNKLIEKDLSITDYLSIASTLGDNLRTNFSIDEIKSFAHLTFDLDFDSMRQITLLDYSNGIRYMTTGTINGISYVLPSAGVGNYSAIQKYVANLLSNDPRAYEEPTILVLNGTDEAGLAATEKTALEKDGYQRVVADNAPEGEYPEGTTLYSVTTEKPGSKALLEKHYNLTAKSAEELPDAISKDYDFIVIINPALAAEDSPSEADNNN